MSEFGVVIVYLIRQREFKAETRRIKIPALRTLSGFGCGRLFRLLELQAVWLVKEEKAFPHNTVNTSVISPRVRVLE
jgi:hypothetical protein